MGAPLEALRALKRRLSDVVYRQMIADAKHADATVERRVSTSAPLPVRAPTPPASAPAPSPHDASAM
ncbi:hypothetical protein JCM9533A_78410 [Catenuloplanes niger JCM 9533]